MKHFKVQELVGRKTYQAHGDRAIRFIDKNLIRCLEIIREGLGKPITVNNWHYGGRLEQRGLRDNTQSILRNKTHKGILYLSAHCLGKAVDFDVKDMEAEKVREWIKANENLFPCKIRLEHKAGGKLISWVHLDVIEEEKNEKVYLFNI